MKEKSTTLLQTPPAHAPVAPSDPGAAYLFHQGTNAYAYRYLGAHLLENGDYAFRVFAPHAKEVFVIGSFNNWEPTLALTRVTEQGLFEGQFSGLSAGMCYKYRIVSEKGTFDKADPYAFYAEKRPRTASVLCKPSAFVWEDAAFLAAQTQKNRRDVQDYYPAPMNIYEVHLGSFKRREGEADADGDRFLNYRELAAELIPYLLQLGYTHIELLPVMEHPLDDSWGYQVCGYFAPTSRFGTPDDFRFFINEMHKAGIGVLLDWVPAHFPKDAHGLCEFDGGYVYEYQGKDRMEHAGWGTRCFDVGRNEVQCFLMSNAIYWLKEFHADGLRVDAVASMLYLDYDRKPGEWIPNVYGDNRNLEAIAFFRHINAQIAAECPRAVLIAEESGDYPKITAAVSEGGLGFHMKWNMGLANDLYDFFAKDPVYRKYHQKSFTFAMLYSLNEHYVLPVSHDEVVHGKKSLLDKMFGSYEEKFAQTRTFLAYLMAHPGKKLLFMGCEYGPFREWDFADELEWFMTKYPAHDALRRYVAKLNRFYLLAREFYEIDFSWDGFEWVMLDHAEENLLAFRRTDRDGNPILALFHFDPVVRQVLLPTRELSKSQGSSGVWREVFNTDAYEFGGGGVTNPLPIKTVNLNGQAMIPLRIGAHSAIYLRPEQPIRRAASQV